MNANPKLNDSENFNNSNAFSNYKLQLGHYYQTMLNAFKQIDKNKDDQLEQKELLEYMDSKMSRGKIFDRNIFRKIMESMDTDNSGTVSLDEFISTYISKHEELKVHQEDLKSKIESDREKMQTNEKLVFDKKSEILNSKSIAKDAKLFIEIISVRPVSINIARTIKNIRVDMDLDGVLRQTQLRPVNNLNFNEKFEFPITTAEENLIVEIYGDNRSAGHTVIPMQTITNQNELVLDLEVNDENDERSVVWVLKLKIQLITSYYKLYQDAYLKAERAYAQNMVALEKINSAIEGLSQPFNFFGGQDSDKYQKQSLVESSSQVPLKEVQVNDVEMDVANKVENMIKSSFNADTVQWVQIIKVLVFANILLSIFNMFIRADFVNFLFFVYVIVVFYTSFNANPLENLKKFLLYLSVSLGYDLLWMCFNPMFAYYSYEGSLKNLFGFLNLIGLFSKLFLLLGIWIHKLKIEKDSNQSLKTPLTFG